MFSYQDVIDILNNIISDIISDKESTFYNPIVFSVYDLALEVVELYRDKLIKEKSLTNQG